ncbi:NADPH:adrenodoxin oxidoreductase, mitochondrial isoform X1 [Vitis riparia]|uniref:NADPH:adrenodoxin oxidoreductase, mitochondrial isoform X1 n=1 Tax=Vitis riparia TaxID=96939 RepID=UPI00155A3D31|nr:NADPH:adrenodoxin oxidoreductase, mitochondrial isoform X1 [Vitis riparia]XP_034700724.1 NADPH:adrenodoxin oxidoreductase, mitochondrial isoform X1 [Vitis riparia]
MAFCRAKTWFSRSFSSLSSNPLRVCVVGSGPAGFYTAEKMLKAHQGAEIDIVDRLPTPFGLVRSGVAPDHPETKIVVNQFSRVAQNDRCSFIGNVTLGSSISLSELRELYHVVVLAYGAESDRVLGIPGEDFAGIHSAREFVWWYNGHPDCKNLDPDLKSTDTAVILGQGNVALDVARILLRPTMELAKTDIASHALAALEESSIRKVYLVGRRGPVQAACTAKELREILGIKDLNVHIQESDLLKSPADEEELKNNRIQRRVYELLSKAASGPSLTSSDQRELHFVFFRKPDRFLDSGDRNGHVAGVRCEKTILKESVGSGKQIAVGTGQFEDLECGIVLKSIGYKSVPINGLPFDHHKGIVPNIQGRVLSNTTGNPTLVEEGLYVCGWLKRGPTGIIATNLYCAEETVASISEDLEQGKLPSTSSLPKPGREGLLQLLAERNVRVLSFSTWEKIDSEEKRLGSLRNKPREKLTTREELLKVTME